MTVEQAEQAIYDLYQRTHRDRPGTRLDPNEGTLGVLWRQFDLAIAREA